jgi:glycosyltransferase involved in cell wall biosynthesis
MWRQRAFRGKQAALQSYRTLLREQFPALANHYFNAAAGTRGVSIYGLFRAEIGIGQSARRSAQSFAAVDYPFSTHNLSLPQFRETVPFDASSDLAPDHAAVLFHLNADTMMHFRDVVYGAWSRGRRSIGFWHWELPVFPARWAEAFDLVDEVWVPSRFVADAMLSATTKPVRIVPHAVPAAPCDANKARLALGLPADDFLFLSTFDTNSFPTRKNPLGAIRAFNDAFPRGGSMRPWLILKMHGAGNRNDTLNEILRLAQANDRIRIIDEVYLPEQMTQLQNACDAYISLHRSEGYGLNIAESMALGKIAVATAFSGNIDFMSDANSLLIPYRMRAVAPGEYVLGDGQWWADPEHDAAVDALRLCINEPARRDRLAAAAARDIAENNSFEVIGRRSVAALQDG